ncbi:MAG: N-acetyl-gamma-glutamyl-phosphate reductase [Actinobacteria bacterium]|jgi:N-acetyl-gamma-glutamyl-phosphate reductase|nr:N-acetyl-gamma-glutamyl-phosphate reductase [Actinomycetota bacterium]NDA94896.1 N-acetyl-gamma-glutamyl-phosphate reductase [Actinomycetota bacterium]NDH81125.1 N-acetyl-gamma-glutamyl-phosphate reductase [Actinomycetota bacterium]NDH99363.1 N-acetyl-gamma-glutamyl-phosphate reductase [Actinomycetota bacterium]
MKTAVIGASGYAGGELIRLLSTHPHLQVTQVSAHSNAGELITSIHPHLTTHNGERFLSFDSLKYEEIEIAFIALPHGQSAGVVEKFAKNTKIVDLGADFRLTDAAQWSRYYDGIHAGAWTYGLPEIPGNRTKISESSKVANPGCYATSIITGVLPALDVIDSSDIVVVAASGTTGAGRNAKISLIASEVMGSLTSYKFGGVHQHTPEVEQALSQASGKEVKISFTPILAPMPRGILSTITARLSEEINTEKAHFIFSEFYKNEFFVDVLPTSQMPKTGSLTGSNKIQMQVAVDEHTNRLVISVAIDNLGKGAASQAIQNANLMCGFHEGAGLSTDGLGV